MCGRPLGIQSIELDRTGLFTHELRTFNFQNLTMEPANQILPTNWLQTLEFDGFVKFTLPTESDADQFLRSIGHALEYLNTGTLVSEPTIVEPVAGANWTTLANDYTPFHNDGLYLYHHPTYVILFCESPAEFGGENLLIRGDHAYQRLTVEVREYLHRNKIRCTVDEYSVARHWVVQHPRNAEWVLLFADPLIQKHSIGACPIMQHQLEIVNELREVVEAGEVQSIRLEKRDILVIDNYRMLHARKAFSGNRRIIRTVVRRFAVTSF